MKCILGDLTPDVTRHFENWKSEATWKRFLAADPTLWTSDSAQHKEIRERLGWYFVLPKMREQLPKLHALREEIKHENYRHVVLLGMGGSSLCPDVLQSTFGAAHDCPTLLVLDSTDPEKIAEIEKLIDLKHTLFVMASKSGGTIEVQSLFRYFHQKSPEGKHYIAITDAGTQLEKQAQKHQFRSIWINPSDIGGRYSALSLFGLVPAALIGMDVARWLDRAEYYAQHLDDALKLGAILGTAALAGQDKLTLLVSPELSSLGAWIEQLIAESTGKLGKGIVPIDLEPYDATVAYGRDRLFVCLGQGKSLDPALREMGEALEKQGHPTVYRQLESAYDLGGEFFHWEMATAVAGAVMGINPFDQPNVQESKVLTNEVLKNFEAKGQLELAKPATPNELKHFFQGLHEGDYVAILAYLPQNDRTWRKLQEIRKSILGRTACATTLGFGPRFLHSTGQLHKGGKANGAFLQITSDKAAHLKIPEASYSFQVLQQAQAEGDLHALRKHGRRALRLHLEGSDSEILDRLHQDILQAMNA